MNRQVSNINHSLHCSGNQSVKPKPSPLEVKDADSFDSIFPKEVENVVTYHLTTLPEESCNRSSAMPCSKEYRDYTDSFQP